MGMAPRSKGPHTPPPPRNRPGGSGSGAPVPAAAPPAHPWADRLYEVVAGALDATVGALLPAGTFDIPEATIRAMVAQALPLQFTWRDVPLEPFAAHGRCPACDTWGLHHFAIGDTVPATEPDELPAAPVVWRDCLEIGCGFVWPQLR